MGSVLTYVSDEALCVSELGPCQHCARPDVPAYNFWGEVIDPNLAADVELAIEEPELNCLCADCINGGNIRRTDTWAVEDTVSRFAGDEAMVWREFNKLPDIPLFIQGKLDWPLCCGGWTEFIGAPSTLAELLALQKTHQYWKAGPSNTPRDFVRDGPPESLYEVSAFACPACNSRYYTDQFT